MNGEIVADVQQLFRIIAMALVCVVAIACLKGCYTIDAEKEIALAKIAAKCPKEAAK